MAIKNMPKNTIGINGYFSELNKKTVQQLRKVAKFHKIKNMYRLRKTQLIHRIIESRMSHIPFFGKILPYVHHGLTVRVFDGSDKKMTDLIINASIDGNMCKNSLNDEYIRHSIPKSNRLLVSFNDKQEVVGFVVLNDDYGSDILYVDMICGVDEPLMRSTMTSVILQAKMEGKKKIMLSSIPEMILWYRRFFEFKLTRSCYEPPKHTSRIEHISSLQKRYNIEQIHENGPFMELLRTLEKNGLSKGIIDKTGCIGSECMIYGYIMTLCL